ncbi:hypothetical protein [Candidatus Similichlamydia epinepheli]|uniref:hypothetical protein n=1 Tax=Candidatus Similichlamydia epinepheli TaxID=1903953 RepID=UPI000D350CFF|nr:hypothetical protein [Candidatus Similichlamydia epinepheli]
MKYFAKFVNRFCLFVSCSYFLAPEIQGAQYLGDRHTLYGNIPLYYQEVVNTDLSAEFPNHQLFALSGIRIYFVVPTTNMSSLAVRAVYKTNYSLRANAPHKDVILSCMTFKIIISQSWFSTVISTLGITHSRVFMSTGGPGIDGLHASPTTISNFLSNIGDHLKTESITETELSTMKASFLTRNTILNSSPETVKNDFINKFLAVPTSDNIRSASVFPHLAGFPYYGISHLYANSFTLQDALNCLSDISYSPIEIMLMDDIVHSFDNIVSNFSSVWAHQRPRTDYKCNGQRRFYSVKGKENVIPCQGGSAGDMSVALIVNLGPLDKESLIAVDLVKTQFQTYANAIGSPLNGYGVTYQVDWVPRGGCALLYITLGTGTPTTLPNTLNHLGILRLAIDQFRRNFTLQEITNNLIPNWPNSLGTNQGIRHYRTWNSRLLGYFKYREWWVELFGGGELAFKELDDFATSITAGGDVGSLYTDVNNIIQTAFSTSKRRFDFWIFLKQ